MRSSASCNSPNTVVAPTSSTPSPITAEATPVAGLAAALSNSSTAAAASVPIRPLSCANTSPRAASSPNTSPAMEMTITSKGASENTL
ncbi:hypothetical protein SAMN04489709_101262 [Paracidovorax citrulli]|nr:hypothetical protein SAMN04489709_101262 [Paracidovorax citrulli]